MNAEMKAVVEDADKAIDQVEDWCRDIRAQQDAEVKQHGARFFTGSAAGWVFTVCDFDIEDQGFPKGTRGCDGAGRHEKKNLVLHLTREMAAKAVKFAAARWHIKGLATCGCGQTTTTSTVAIICPDCGGSIRVETEDGAIWASKPS